MSVFSGSQTHAAVLNTTEGNNTIVIYYVYQNNAIKNNIILNIKWIKKFHMFL